MFKNKAEKDSAKLSQATTRTSFDSQDLIDDNSTEYSSPSSRMDTEGSVKKFIIILLKLLFLKLFF